jgi:hypothetical protein
MFEHPETARADGYGAVHIYSTARITACMTLCHSFQLLFHWGAACRHAWPIFRPPHIHTFVNGHYVVLQVCKSGTISPSVWRLSASSGPVVALIVGQIYKT